MGSITAFENEKLVIGVLLSRLELKSELLGRLQQSFGPADWVSSELPFDYTHYYDAQMGAPITRFFVSCRELVDPSLLAEIKRTTNGIEEEFRRLGLRPINLDPGLLSLARFVLASTKPSAHRLPLASGIYAEIELLYERGAFRPVEWTYPDYRSREYLEILGHIRGLLKAQRST
jgi:hypothetical protein